MSAVSKDQSIVMQVAGKIAADLTPKGDDTMTNVGNWMVAFDAISEQLLSSMGLSVNASSTEAPLSEQQIIQAFAASPAPTTTMPTGGSVRVKGQQHGPLPEWLFAEAKKAGVTEVWDNRDGLAVNPKRPWFKAVTGDKAFWAPKSR